jgi:hypothetical protein
MSVDPLLKKIDDCIMAILFWGGANASHPALSFHVIDTNKHMNIRIEQFEVIRQNRDAMKCRSNSCKAMNDLLARIRAGI